MDTAVKIFQIIFYITGSIIAVLTFVKAKNGLLNSVNTEYQKRVIDRLSLLSDELYEEFDSSSLKYWGRSNPVKTVLERLHREILPHKDEIISTKQIEPRIFMPDNLNNLKNYLNKLKTDPFIPKKIRNEVVGKLEARAEILFFAYVDEISAYKDGLKEGNYWESLDTNYTWISNNITERAYKNGVGLSQVEETVHELRLLVQDYLEQFNPLK